MASAYGDRPWLRLHQPGKPADITPEHFDALTMWRSGLARGVNGNGTFTCRRRNSGPEHQPGCQLAGFSVAGRCPDRRTRPA
jgi:hypothetical protein